MNSSVDDVRQRLDLVLSRMSLHLPFIAAVAMTMEVKVEKCRSGTAETNGSWVKFDPEFVRSLDDANLMGLYAHEAMHKALMHPWRRSTREPRRWNGACDHVINLSLQDMGNFSLRIPGNGLMNPKYRGMSEEQVYEVLDDADDGGGDGGGDGDGDLVDAPDRSQADVEIEVVNIAKACQMAGVKSGLIDQILGNAAKSGVRWQDVLRAFVSSAVRSGCTWKRPSRRSAGLGVYLPDLRSKQIGSIVVFADVSGSMHPLLQEITNELQGIIDDASPECTHVVCGDTRVTHVETFGRGARISLRCSGGGGTDFRPMFDEVPKQGWEPDCAVFLTDTYGTFPKAPSNYPVIWAVLGTSRDVSVPWGEIVKVGK